MNYQVFVRLLQFFMVAIVMAVSDVSGSTFLGSHLDGTNTTWNRINDRAGYPDSVNNGLPYEVLEIKSATGGTLNATINAPTQFDSFLALYDSTGFMPGSPGSNLLAADDDSGGYPHAGLSRSGLAANTSYYLVVTSYSSQAGSVYPLYGNYFLTLSGDFRVVNPTFPPSLGGTFTTNGAINDTATINPFSGVTVTDANNDNVSITITYTAANGTLTGTGLTGSAGSYTLTSAAPATVAGNLQGLIFHPTANQVAPGSTVVSSFALTPSDAQGAGTGNSTSTVTVTSINDAPAFSGDGTLPSVRQATADPPGATIGTLFGGLFSDADTGASLSGIAVTGNSANAGTEGKWQYSTDGTAWFDVGTTSDAASLALATATKVRFLPLPAFNGNPAALSVRAIDTTYSGGWTSGAVRVTPNVSVNGGTTAFAGAARVLNTTITVFNPTLTVTISGNGSVTSDNGNGTNYACNTPGVCPAMTFTYNDSVTVTATGSNSSFGGWSGDYISTDNPGSITMNGNKAVTATFTANPALVKVDGDTTAYYAIGTALDACFQDGVVRAQASPLFAENVLMTNAHTLKLRGGFSDAGFTDGSQSGYSTVSGSLKVRSGKLIVERVKVLNP